MIIKHLLNRYHSTTIQGVPGEYPLNTTPHEEDTRYVYLWTDVDENDIMAGTKGFTTTFEFFVEGDTPGKDAYYVGSLGTRHLFMTEEKEDD